MASWVPWNKEEFQFGRHDGGKAHSLGAGDLALEYLARGEGDGSVGVVIENIAEAEGGALQPRHWAQCAQVWLHDVIAVARRPTGGGVAIGSRHFQVGRQEIVAAVGFAAVGDFEKGFGVQAFAHEPPLHIDDAG